MKRQGFTLGLASDTLKFLNLYIYDSWKIQMLQNKLNFKENNNKSIVFDDGDDTT